MRARNQHLGTRLQRGVTLIELMVSITIGMVLVLFVSTLYLSSRTSYRVNDDNSRMQEEGRAAMNIIGRNLMQGGFGQLVSSDMSTLVLKADLTDFKEDAIYGCNNGFAEPANFANKTCATAGTDTMGLQVGYRIDDAASVNTNIGAGTDCNGQTASKNKSGTTFGTNEVRYVINRFYMNTATRTLSCIGTGGGVQPLLSNVDNMLVTYGITNNPDVDADGFKSVNSYVAAGNVTDWGSVISVNVCLELSSPNNNVTTQAQTYQGCDNADKTAGDRRLHTTIRGVYTLRNNASVRNFSMKPAI